MNWFWYFVVYSFLGFLLEVGYARATGGQRERKCLLVLPLCPVYGLGACAILWLAELGAQAPLWVLLSGTLAATGVEYLMAVWYERGLGVSFWDYRQLPGNIQGRVCLPFSAAWGLLALALVYWVHPWVREWTAAIPNAVSLSAFVLVAADTVVSSVMMRRTGSRACLQWYRRWAG